MTLGLLFSHRLPALTAKLQKPLANFSLLARLAFIVLGLIKERQLLTLGLLPTLAIVIAHNASGLGCALFWRRQDAKPQPLAAAT